MRSIFITGCSSGIGLMSAVALKKRGYYVIPSCRKEQDQEKLHNLGFEHVILLDMDDPNSVDSASSEVLRLTNGNLYALFNNAGFGIYGALNTVSRKQLESQFSTNFFGVHQLTQNLLPSMLANNEGRIIQTSSIVGVLATPGRMAYTCSKYALEAWSDTLRLELHKTNIKVSLIEPGPLETQFKKNVLQTEQDHLVTNPPIAKKFALPPEAVLPKLYHALESKHPKTRYRVTFVTQLAALGKRVLPDKWLDKILSSQ